MIFRNLGDGGAPIIEELALTLQEEKGFAAPPLNKTLTIGGENEGLYGIVRRGGKVYRPYDSLSFDTIDDMMKNGQVMFAYLIKVASIYSVLRNERSWMVKCKDEKMTEIVRGIMSRVFDRYAQEFMTCIPYGVAFFEKQWSYEDAAFWDIDGPTGKFYGYSKLLSMHPRTIDHIKYTRAGGFDGFVQNQAGSITAGRPVSIIDGSTASQQPVPPDLAFVLTYDKRFRNLWGNSAFDVAYSYWFWYEIALRSFMRYLERSGTPVVICEAPARGKTFTPDGSTMDNMKYAFLVAGYAAKSNAIALPSDRDQETGQPLWNLRYLTDDKRGDQFIKALELFATLITRALVVGDRAAMQTGQTGSYAESRSHMIATQLHNELMLGGILRQANDYLVTPIVKYNSTTATTPYATIETEGLDPEEKDRLFSFLNTAGNQAGTDAMSIIDWEQIYRVSNIPTLSKEEAEEKYQEQLKKTKEKAEMFQSVQGEPQKGLPPKDKPPKGPQPPKDETVRGSLDFLLYQISSGATIPLAVTQQQAIEIADRFKQRPTVFDMAVSENVDDVVDRIVAKAIFDLRIPADIPIDTLKAIENLILAYLGMERTGAALSDDDIVALGVIDTFLNKLYSRLRMTVDKAVKAITGESLNQWRARKKGESLRYTESVQTAIIVTRKDGSTYIWNPQAHPRDDAGRWTKKFEADLETEKIVSGIMWELDIPESATQEDLNALRDLILVQLGLGNATLSEDILLSKFGDWLKKIGSKIKRIANRVVKKVTGRSLDEWKGRREGAKEARSKVSTGVVVVTRKDGTTYVWDPAQHPRDESGQFAKHEAGKQPEEETGAGAETRPREPFADLDWSNLPGADPEKGVSGTLELEGFTYKVLGGVTEEEVRAAHEANLRIRERSKEIGYPVTPTAPFVIADLEDPESLAKFMGIELDHAKAYVEASHGMIGMYNDLEDPPYIMFADKATRDPYHFEAMLFHETLHSQTRENNQMIRGAPMKPEEAFTTIITSKYAEEYGLINLIGYPQWVSWVSESAQRLGWSKDQLYDYAIKAHKADGQQEYTEWLEGFADEAGVERKEFNVRMTGEEEFKTIKMFTAEWYPDALQDYWPDWEESASYLEKEYDFNDGELLEMLIP